VAVNGFPTRCLRGLRKDEDVTPEGLVNSSAFHPDFRSTERRAGGEYETSINWEDDSAAIAFTMSRRDQSAYGIAALPRVVIDAEKATIQTAQHIPSAVTYDRQPQPGNKYHGSIVYSGMLSKQFIKMLASMFAVRAGKPIPRPD